jgi:hypothetical protein
MIDQCLVVKNWTCKDIPVSASDFVPSRLLIDQLCISIFQIYSTENITIKYIEAETGISLQVQFLTTRPYNFKC